MFKEVVTYVLKCHDNCIFSLHVYFQVASFTGEKQAVSSLNKFLVDAYKSGIHEGSLYSWSGSRFGLFCYF